MPTLLRDRLSKQRRPKRKKLRKAIRKQLSYLRRNLAHIDGLITAIIFL